MKRSTVYRQAGRFAGWPANYGMWAWGSEVLVVFAVGWTGPLRGVHARDTSRPFEPVQARSSDGGRTWTTEPFTGHTPGSSTLSGDEHVDQRLKARPRITSGDFAVLADPVDFEDPETIVMCARTDLDRDSLSWFYVSGDRGRSWSGPYRVPSFGLQGVSARTDIVALGKHEALFMMSGTKSNGNEGRVFAVSTTDGGRSLERLAYVGPEPEGWSIMPSSMRLTDGTILSALRCSGRGDHRAPTTHRIDLYASTDAGKSWEYTATPVESTGYAGNPPAFVRTADGVLVIVYGYRDAPRGLRCVTSRDDGQTWSAPAVLTDDTPSHDMGYPKAVALGNEVLAVYYSNAGPESERFVEAVRWTPSA